jgi:hypothetical protein
VLWSALVTLGVTALGTGLVALAAGVWRERRPPAMARVAAAAMTWPAALPPARAGRQVWVVPQHRAELVRLLARHLVTEGPVFLLADVPLEGAPQVLRCERLEQADHALPGRPLLLTDHRVEAQLPTLMLVLSGEGVIFTADEGGLYLDEALVFRLEQGELSFA